MLAGMVDGVELDGALLWLAALELAGTAVFGLALGLDGLLRRRSAAVRRGLWALAMAVALLLPLTRLALPAPSVALMPGLAAALLGVWAIGAAGLLVRLGVGVAQARRMRAASVPLVDAGWAASLAGLQEGGRPAVELRVCDASRAPVVVGVRRAAVLVPRELLTIAATGRRSLLAHELAHVARGDVVLLLAGALVRAIYWVCPLAWWALRRLRARAEDAADDAVLQAGVPSSSYAAQLVAVARAQLERAGRVTAGGLRARVGAVLDVRRVRGPARGRRFGLPRLVGAALVLATLVTACEARSQEPGAHVGERPC